MSRRPRGTRPVIVVATLLSGALALGGCSAGSVTATDTVVSQAAGARGSVGAMVLLDVSLDSGPTETVPSGAEVPLRGTLVNEGAEPDRLVSVSSPYAVGARQEGSPVIPGENAVRMLGAEPGPAGPVDPANRGLTASTRVVLTGVTQQLRSGPTYAVTFTFERAGAVTIPVIVVGSGPTEG
jgi:copper(I)-binding protein